MREKNFKKRNIPKFPIHYYTKIAAKTGTHDKIILFFASKRGTVPPKEEQLASMPADPCKTFDPINALHSGLGSFPPILAATGHF